MRLREGTAGEAGFSADGLALIRKRAEEWIEAGDVHRTLVLLAARHGVVALHEAFGVDGPEPDAAPLNVDAIFPTLSQTKSITATLAMQLVEDGLLGLTRPVQDYLPEFVGERKDSILVHHLLTHTSGIDDNDFFLATGRLAPQMTASIGNASPGQHPMEHLLLELAYVWPAAHPAGEMARYCQLNFLLVGEIIRRVSGRSLDELAQERIFGPLEMVDSSYGLPDHRADRVVRRDLTDTPDMAYAHSERGRGMMGGAGGVYSTARDLAGFMQMLLDDGRGPDGQRVLHPSSVARMTTDQTGGVPVKVWDRVIPSGSAGFGWLVAAPRPPAGPGWPHLPRGSITHGGMGFVLPWADPSSGAVGVFCSVADRMPATGSSPSDLLHHGDLFADLVTAAVAD